MLDQIKANGVKLGFDYSDINGANTLLPRDQVQFSGISAQLARTSYVDYIPFRYDNPLAPRLENGKVKIYIGGNESTPTPVPFGPGIRGDAGSNGFGIGSWDGEGPHAR